ncbi:MAG: hypothetical protein LBD97_00180 [Bifidobacteriaceae bacterium]|nr:hypothetical protein [Bifidobacteriaceae bacterium]
MLFGPISGTRRSQPFRAKNVASAAPQAIRAATAAIQMAVFDRRRLAWR